MSKSTTVAISIVVLVVAVVGAFFVLKGDSSNQANSEQASSNPTNQTNSDSNESSNSSGKTYSSTEVAVHNSATDCWTIISGKVYNITTYIDRHDGGDEILRACGIDGTTLFTERKTSSGEELGTGTPHSASAQDQLNKLIIGELKNQ